MGPNANSSSSSSNNFRLCRKLLHMQQYHCTLLSFSLKHYSNHACPLMIAFQYVGDIFNSQDCNITQPKCENEKRLPTLWSLCADIPKKHVLFPEEAQRRLHNAWNMVLGSNSILYFFKQLYCTCNKKTVIIQHVLATVLAAFLLNLTVISHFLKLCEPMPRCYVPSFGEWVWGISTALAFK